MEDLKLRYDPEVITRWESHQGPDQFLTRLPHLLGVYNSSDLAKTIVGWLIDEGLPVLTVMLHPAGGSVSRHRGFQKVFGSQSNNAVAMLKKRIAVPRISFLSRGSPHFSPTPHRKRTIA
jgi:hypothetical protein